MAIKKKTTRPKKAVKAKSAKPVKAAKHLAKAAAKPAKKAAPKSAAKKTAVPKTAPKQASAKGGAFPQFRETPDEKRVRAVRVSNTLRAIYGHIGTALKYSDPFHLIVATVLSAQSTDETVNRTTPVLFGRYPDAAALAKADPAEVEKIIHSTGFFRQKTKSIMAVAQDLVTRFDGKVPESMEELTTLRGVGRKTANLVRAEAYGHPGLIVDTHFRRVSQRLGLATTDDPDKIEMQLADLLPEDHWTEFSNSMIWHGRRICTARAPKCPECPVLADCPYGQAAVKGK